MRIWLLIGIGGVLAGCPSPSSTVPGPDTEPPPLEVCVFGLTESQPCPGEGGHERVRACMWQHADCHEAGCATRWSSYSACPVLELPGGWSCLPGEQRRHPCGPSQTGVAVTGCEADAAPGDVIPCDASPDACGADERPGACAELQAMFRAVCLHGAWVEEPCMCGGATTLPCGPNGSGRRRVECAPDEPAAIATRSTCEPDPGGFDACVDGSTVVAPCGCNGRGVQRFRCEAGRFVAEDACEDPAMCIDGALRRVDDPCESEQIAVELCAHGRWTSLGCVEERVECHSGRPAEIDGRTVCVPHTCDDGVQGPREEQVDLGGDCGDARYTAEEAARCGTALCTQTGPRCAEPGERGSPRLSTPAYGEN